VNPRCSTLAQGEPLAGTAPYATAWIALEFPGTWGKRALSDAELPSGFGDAIIDGTAGTGVQVVLVRRSRAAVREHHILVSAGGKLRRGSTSDLGVILDWDMAALGSGILPNFGEPDEAPHTLICTNSARDQCCAIEGRALVTSLAGTANLWESSHLGGHRFAPVLLQLPSTYVYGRLSPEVAELIVTDPTTVQLPSARGRTNLPQPLQAAELAVRRHLDLTDQADVVSVETAQDDGDVLHVTVTTRTQGKWQVRCSRIELELPRPESCTGEPVAGHRWNAEVLVPHK